MYVAGYTFVRFFIERLRIDEASLIWGLRVNEWVSAGMFLLSVGILVVMNFHEPAPPGEQDGEPHDLAGGVDPTSQRPRRLPRSSVGPWLTTLCFPKTGAPFGF